MHIVSMKPNDDDAASSEPADILDGASVYLAGMILEVQQMALRLGAGEVSATLQTAYLQARLLQPKGSGKAGN